MEEAEKAIQEHKQENSKKTIVPKLPKQKDILGKIPKVITN